jgi:hypothetical protein
MILNWAVLTVKAAMNVAERAHRTSLARPRAADPGGERSSRWPDRKRSCRLRQVKATKATSARPAPCRTARPTGTATEAHGGWVPGAAGRRLACLAEKMRIMLHVRSTMLQWKCWILEALCDECREDRPWILKTKLTKFSSPDERRSS